MGKHSITKKQRHSSGSGSVKKSVREGSKLAKPRKLGRDSSIAASPPDQPKKQKKLRKTHKWKAGTLAAMEVKRYQTGKKATCPLITKQAIEDLMRDTLAECGVDYRIQKSAILDMRAALEEEAIRLFESSRVLALHAKRKTIDVKDMRAVAKVRKIYPGSSETGGNSFFHTAGDGDASHKKKKKKKAADAAATVDESTIGEETIVEETHGTTGNEPTTSDD